METDPIFDAEPRRMWDTADDDSHIRCYLGIRGRTTLADLVEHLLEKYPLTDSRTLVLQMNHVTAIWEEPPTVDDVKKRHALREWNAARTEKWERETYARLKVKFGE
jgi:hypothetical protein